MTMATLINRHLIEVGGLQFQRFTALSSEWEARQYAGRCGAGILILLEFLF